MVSRGDLHYSVYQGLSPLSPLSRGEGIEFSSPKECVLRYYSYGAGIVLQYAYQIYAAFSCPLAQGGGASAHPTCNPHLLTCPVFGTHSTFLLLLILLVRLHE